jgi:hypothetical protein
MVRRDRNVRDRLRVATAIRLLMRILHQVAVFSSDCWNYVSLVASSGMYDQTTPGSVAGKVC